MSKKETKCQRGTETARTLAAELSRRTRAEQGLPLVVQDLEALQQIDMVLRGVKPSARKGDRVPAQTT